ncbi:hypothetical protein [Aureimonas sp. ME7]|uniref:hypothetical protein n=1 Tax=Aureimonas sp. ME7 TaxID=2744252 RepID=UPI0015FA040D|nr:hypothetical protein [Aureimonas sp. ME7]
MNPYTIETLQAHRRLVALQARLAEIRAQEAQVDAVRCALRVRLRQHRDFATRASMSITEDDLETLLDALDRADKSGRAAS